MSGLLVVQLAGAEIERYAQQLIELVEPLSAEQLWAKPGRLPNSIGTLCRHLTGNLNHYFGAGLLNNGYRRQRDNEFTETGLPKAQVLAELQAAVGLVGPALAALDEEEINGAYTTSNGEEYESLAQHILRLTTHWALHYGQADYARHCLP